MKRVALALVLLSFALPAQQPDEPTPFWMPPPPPKKEEKPAKKKKKKPAPVQVEPLEIKQPPQAQTPTFIEPAAPRPEPPSPPAPVPQAPVQQVAPRVAPTPAPAPLPAPVPTPQLPPPAAIIAQPEPPQPEPEPEPVRETRNWTFDALGGAWGKSRSDGGGRTWDLAYGLRAGYGFLDDRAELELSLIRAGGSSGSPFVNTALTHNLVLARAFWVLGDSLALLLGGGAGVALAQTHYTLQDVGGNPIGLDANALKSVIEVTAGGRWRIVGGLQLRGEVSGVLRDGRIEILPLFGLGWAL